MTWPMAAPSSLRGLLLLSLFPLISVLPATSSAADDAGLTLEVGIEYFRWQEFDDGDRRLLTEHGPRLMAAASYDNHALSVSGMLYALRINGYVAEVDYDGQDSNGRFVATRTGYRGWRGEFDLGWRSAGLGDGNIAVDLIGGIGIEEWRRDIRSNINSLGQQVSGLIEDYSVVYARTGIGILHYPGPSRGYLHVGARYPLSVDEEVVFFGQLLRLNPEPRWSALVSYEILLNPLIRSDNLDPRLRFYYESWRFARSNLVPVGDRLVWQPKSNLDAFGVMLGASF